jgi:hypothetical protein
MSINTAQEIIALKGPSFSSDPRLADFVALAKKQISSVNFGTNYEYACALLVLHWLTLEKQGGGSSTVSGSGVVGGIKSEAEGDLSRSYGSSGAAGNSRNEYYGSTCFGQEFLALWKGNLILPRNSYVGPVTR